MLTAHKSQYTLNICRMNDKDRIMVGKIGKILRKLRIDHNEALSDMAKKLDLSPSYLSAIENTKRNIPSEMFARLQSLYGLTDEMMMSLVEAEASVYNKIQIELPREINDVFTAIAIQEIKKAKTMNFENMRNQIQLKKLEMFNRIVLKAIEMELEEKGGL